MISQPFLSHLDALDIYEHQTLTLPELWQTLMYEHWNSGDVKAVMKKIAQQSFYELSKAYGFSFDVKAHIAKLHKDKNAGYSGNNPDPWYNVRQCESFGISVLDGVLTRMCDKYTRLTNVLADPSLDRVNEPLAEVYRDLGSYAIIYCCLLDEKQQFGFVLEGFMYGSADGE